jgi:N-[(2S)-2-amino-2-carboxyethyl]-L-glutamate dehydrogenase
MPEEYGNDLLYLCKQDVEQICEELDSVAVVREVFVLHGSGQAILPDEAYMGWINEAGEQARSLNMPASIQDSF